MSGNIVQIDKDKYKEFWRLIVKLVQKKDVFFSASAITFNLIICSVPFVLLLISITGYLLSFEDAFQEIIRYGTELFPSFSYETQAGDVYEGAVTLENILTPLIGVRQVFGIVGIIVLVFFAQGLFHTVKHVVFEIFEIEDRKHPILEMIYNFFTFGIVGGVFIFFSLVISMVSVISFDQINLPFTDRVMELSWAYEFLNIVIPVAFTILLFYIIFRYISEKRLHHRVSLVGAAVYTLLFETAKYGVGFYLDYAFRAYRYFYQGYAIAIVIGIWVFYSALLLVLSIIVARAYQDAFLHETHLKENPYTSIS